MMVEMGIGGGKDEISRRVLRAFEQGECRMRDEAVLKELYLYLYLVYLYLYLWSLDVWSLYVWSLYVWYLHL